MNNPEQDAKQRELFRYLMETNQVSKMEGVLSPFFYRFAVIQVPQDREAWASSLTGVSPTQRQNAAEIEAGYYFAVLSGHGDISVMRCNSKWEAENRFAQNQDYRRNWLATNKNKNAPQK